MPLQIDPVAVLERLNAMLNDAPYDLRLMRAVEWVKGEIAAESVEVAA